MFAFLKLLLLASLVSLNAFFVAAEYSLLSVRKTRLDQLIDEGNAHARLLRQLLADTGQLFSGIQLGITVASLLMGWLGEHIVADAIEALLAGHLHHYASLAIAHSVALGVAFLCVTLLLMVLGELVPKTLAYERAEHVALALAWPLSVFFRLSRHPVNLLDRISSGVVRFLGPEPPKRHGPQHSPEEVKLIVSAIRQRGLLEEEQEEMIHGVFELDRVRVSEIMVPWPKVTCLPATADLRVLLNQVVKDQHSRIPIYEGAPDHIIGVLYTKDLLALILERQRNGVSLEAPFDIHGLLHAPMTVPEAMPLNQMLEEARVRRAQMALVVDEFGTFTGLVTLEDVLEEIVGEIQDEYDWEERPVEKLRDGSLVVDGTVSAADLRQNYEIPIPDSEDFDTVAGFMLDCLGSVPRGGEVVQVGDWRLTVVDVEKNRISKVKIERVPAAVKV
jgi:putative hemolysin